MNLLELQRRMADDVRRPLTGDFTMQPSVEGTANDAGYIKPNSSLSSFERLEIYNRQYWFRVMGALAEDYPALNAVLGAKRFDAMVLAYLAENPSTSFTLRNLGAKLPAWLAVNGSFARPLHTLAVDVARLEWAYVEAFDSASLKPLGMEEFAALGGESTLRLQPHLQLLHLRYPVDEIVLDVRQSTREMDIVSNASSERKQTSQEKLPRVARRNTYLAVHRFDDCVYYRRIDREAFLILRALGQGESIEAAIRGAFAHSRTSPEQQAEQVKQYFAHAAELGWFCPASASGEQALG